MRASVVLAAALLSCGGHKRTNEPPLSADGLTYAQLWAASGSIQLALGRCVPDRRTRTSVKVRVGADGQMTALGTFTAEHAGCIARAISSLRVDNPSALEEELDVSAAYDEIAGRFGVVEFVMRTRRWTFELDTTTSWDNPCDGAVSFTDGALQLSPKTDATIRLRNETRGEVSLSLLCIVVDGTRLFAGPTHSRVLVALSKHETVDWKGPVTQDTAHQVTVLAQLVGIAHATSDYRVRFARRASWTVTEGAVLEVTIRDRDASNKLLARPVVALRGLVRVGEVEQPSETLRMLETLHPPPD